MAVSGSIISNLTLKKINCFCDFNSTSISPLKYLSPKISKALQGIFSPSADLFFVMLSAFLGAMSKHSKHEEIIPDLWAVYQCYDICSRTQCSHLFALLIHINLEILSHYTQPTVKIQHKRKEVLHFPET